MIRRLEVNLADDSYPIYIGAGLLDDPSILIRHIAGQRACLVSNTCVGPLFRDRVTAALDNCEVTYLELPDGEKYKNLDTLNLIFDHLLSHRYDRSATLIALGGGVIGDMTGFAAACYQRGVEYLQVPTTLLAQVDSSIGGKTAVNHPLGKNMIGAFKQPRCVLIDTDSLSSLPQRELRAGMAEVIKHGAIRDGVFFEWLETHLEDLYNLEPRTLAHTIERNCQIKSSIVSADEKEQGIRTLLNFGHTFGHAIETAMGYGEWLHGEAVATGMVMAADLSWRLGHLELDQAARLKRLIAAAGLPTAPPQLEVDQFIDLMQHDKKVNAGEIRFVLLNQLGEARLHNQVDASILKLTLTAGTDLCSG